MAEWRRTSHATISIFNNNRTFSPISCAIFLEFDRHVISASLSPFAVDSLVFQLLLLPLLLSSVPFAHCRFLSLSLCVCLCAHLGCETTFASSQMAIFVAWMWYASSLARSAAMAAVVATWTLGCRDCISRRVLLKILLIVWFDADETRKISVSSLFVTPIPIVDAASAHGKTMRCSLQCIDFFQWRRRQQHKSGKQKLDSNKIRISEVITSIRYILNYSRVGVRRSAAPCEVPLSCLPKLISSALFVGKQNISIIIVIVIITVMESVVRVRACSSAQVSFIYNAESGFSVLPFFGCRHVSSAAARNAPIAREFTFRCLTAYRQLPKSEREFRGDMCQWHFYGVEGAINSVTSCNGGAHGGVEKISMRRTQDAHKIII